MAEWSNRIVKHDVLPASQFLSHPMNFRIHPPLQQAATKGSLDELGWIDEVIVNIQTQHVINGHLRISLALRQGDETPVPVKYVSLSPEEELTALAIFDPITGMAVADKGKLDALLRDVKPPMPRCSNCSAIWRRRKGCIRAMVRRSWKDTEPRLTVRLSCRNSGRLSRPALGDPKPHGAREVPSAAVWG